MKVDEKLAAELIPNGVATLFTLVGEEAVLFAGHSASRGVRVLVGRHESATVGMADGYYRASGNVGVAVLSRGPGLTNGLTAITCATRAGSGVVVLVGDSPPTLTQLPPTRALANDFSHKYVDQQGLLEAAHVPSITVRSADSAVADVRAALSWAKGGGTVVVNVSHDVMRAEAGELGSTVVLPSRPTGPEPSPERLAEVVDLLMSHNKVVILAGRGAVRSGAGEALRRLGDATDALLATSLLAKGYFADAPFNVGILGGLATPVARELLADADLLLAFGASLNPYTVFHGKMHPKAKVVQIDHDPSALGRFTPVHVEMVGDARDVAAELAGAVERGDRRKTGYRTSDVAERIAAFRWADEIEDEGAPGAIDPRLLMLRLDEILPEHRTVVVDSGRQWANPLTYLSSADVGSTIFPHDAGALGAAIGVSLGVSIARPDRLVAVCLGDLALMMSLPDFETAVRYGLPVLVVVSNNSAYEKAKTMLRSENLPDEMAKFANPSFVEVARGLGADGMTINRIEDLDSLPARLDGLRGPLLLDCRTSSEISRHGEKLLQEQSSA